MRSFFNTDDLGNHIYSALTPVYTQLSEWQALGHGGKQATGTAGVR